MKRAIAVLTLALMVLVATEQPAYAYSDPGSATLLWQIVVSSLIGVGYYFRKFIIHITREGDKKKKTRRGNGGDE